VTGQAADEREQTPPIVAQQAQYAVTPTSPGTAQVTEVPLSPPQDAASGHTRQVLRAHIIDNTRDADSPVNADIVHQRRASSKRSWEDSRNAPLKLSSINAGTEVRVHLGAFQTKKLYEALRDLYAIGATGVPQEKQTLTVVNADEAFVATGREREVLQRLLETQGEGLWHMLEQIDPDLTKRMALAEVYESRQKVASEFEQHLQADDWSETEWEGFFRANPWIFGHNLTYEFLNEVQGQAHYGGTTLSGRGGQRGEFLMATEAEARFTVLVEIKKPSSLLLGKQYRNKVYELGEDLAGGVAQLQSNCRTWVIDGSHQEENVEALREQSIFTYESRGILVIGHTRELDNLNKKATFELFRRNLHNPDVLTFDELLARAQRGVRFDVS
jgi:Domain of unknown function (DUF4263)